MEFYDVVRSRRSVRKYQKKDIPEEVLRRILDAARLAPSASNLQSWRFIVIRNQESKNVLAKLYKERTWIADAAVIIAGVGTDPDYRMGSGRPSYDIDLSIAMTHMMLAATAESLGSCWIGSFDYEKTKRFLGIPEKFPLVGFLTIGYPDETPPPSERKKLEEIVYHEKWGE